MDDRPEVIVCAGPPDCDLEDEAAVKAAQAGCPMCRHLKINPDGSTEEYRVNPN